MFWSFGPNSKCPRACKQNCLLGYNACKENKNWWCCSWKREPKHVRNFRKKSCVYVMKIWIFVHYSVKGVINVLYAPLNNLEVHLWRHMNEPVTSLATISLVHSYCCLSWCLMSPLILAKLQVCMVVWCRLPMWAHNEWAQVGVLVDDRQGYPHRFWNGGKRNKKGLADQ